MNPFSANLLHQWRWQIPVWRYFDFTCQSIKLTEGCRSTAHDALAFLLLLLMFKLSVRSICLFDNISHYVCSCSENVGSLYTRQSLSWLSAIGLQSGKGAGPSRRSPRRRAWACRGWRDWGLARRGHSFRCSPSCLEAVGDETSHQVPPWGAPKKNILKNSEENLTNWFDFDLVYFWIFPQ